MEENNIVQEKNDKAYISLRHINKIYDNNVQAVFDFSLDIAKHEFIVFVGPSGCGKSTTLRMIAGLEDISSGELYIDGNYSNDRSPKDRDIAMVFQSYALYPHMSVYDNMAFGLKIRHYPRAEIDKRVREAARILQIEEYLERKPKALSGGQRQRVALGRAIVRNAKAFLMDEPLSNLDAKLRVQMRSEIIKLHESLNATTIYVTHDQTEAMTMASRIVVMKAGYIQQIGTPFEIYNHPSNLFVATFIGSPSMNIIKATYSQGKVIFSNGKEIKMDEDFIKGHDEFYHHQRAQVEEKIAKLNKEAQDATPKALVKINASIEALNKEKTSYENSLTSPHEIAFGIRPEDIHEINEENEAKYASSDAKFDLEVSVAELLGHEYYIHADFAGVDLISKVPTTKVIKLHDHIQVAFDLKKAHCFDVVSTSRIY